MARVTLQEYCDYARKLIDSHQYAEAIAVCRHILKRYPRHIRTYQILGEACLEKGELTEAMDIFKRLLENADPENFSAYAGLGVAYQEKGQLTEAIWYMERAFELAPNNEETRNTLRQLYTQRDGKEPERIRHSKAALARLYARGGQYRQAIEEFRQLLELEGSRGRLDLKVSLAETLWRDGRREQASELAREILQTAPDCLKATLLLGRIALEKGRQEEGAAILERARGLDPENKVAQALFGETSPLPLEVVMIPRMEGQAEVPVAPPAPAAIAVEPAVEEISPGAEVSASISEETEALSAEESPLAEETAVGAEPTPAVSEAATPEPVPNVAEPPVAHEAEGTTPGTAVEQVSAGAPVVLPESVISSVHIAPAPAEAAPKKKRGRQAAPEATVLEAAAGVAAGPLSDIERYQLLLEQKPKDDELRLALARAYRDGSQMKPALEQYAVLVHAKQKLLPEIIADVEGIVASRPDNLEAHELLADLYGKNGQLQKALERYRWVLDRLQQGN